MAKSEGLLVKVKKLAADQIYATNDNRNYLTEEKIITKSQEKAPKQRLTQIAKQEKS